MANPVESRVSDLHVVETSPLPSPETLCREIARRPEHAAFVIEARRHIQAILKGEESRFLLVVGPCSIHDVKAGEEYARRLADLSARVAERILIVMRVYFEKPRTTVGWKGLIMDPQLDGSHDIPKGLRMAREFLLKVLDLGVPTATELLDPITPQYIADLICWSAIGARTTESQTHRQMASGLSMPLGFKNATNGSVEPALNAIKAAMQPQTFLGVNEQGVASSVSTEGNPNCHMILRGGEDGPNYDETSVAEVIAALKKLSLPPGIMVDASHANSGKDHTRQPEVFREIIRQRVAGNGNLIGSMLESNLLAGNQKFPQPRSDLEYGKSITDACIDWETTERIVLEAFEALG